MDGRTRRLGLGAAAVVTATTAMVVPATLGSAAGVTPSLRLLVGLHHIEADRFGSTSDLYLPQSVYIAATHGAFEVDATKRHGHISLEQVQRNGSAVKRLRNITPAGPVSFETGLPKFFSLVVTDSSGAVVASAHPSFCPTADYNAQRVTPNGADNPTFPQSCGDNLTRATVWGIDAGWAVPPYFDIVASPTALPDGKYTLSVAIAPPYAHELGVSPADSKVTMAMAVVTQTGGCAAICPGGSRSQSRVPSARTTQRQLAGRSGPYPPSSHGSGLPDLRALPAHGLQISHHAKSGKDFLGFGATIWNAGPGTFDVEGFRHNGKPTMNARQYVYRNGRSVRSMSIGKFEFDARKGHQHWHLEDVARYDLLDAQKNRVLLSSKQSFCLAPTDPLDLTRPGAEWNPYNVGLESSCPTDQSLWLRETLPIGWGDTYVQNKGGQAFNITNLPNGRYLIRIATNPFGRIHETNKNNDTALLAIDLGGTPGARTVTRVH